MLPLVTAQTVALTVGSEDGFREGEHMPGKLKPLDVEREIRPGKYSHVTVHGFRSTFATWAEECTDSFRRHVQRACRRQFHEFALAASRRRVVWLRTLGVGHESERIRNSR
jgi:hypothetical protein